MNHPRNLWLFLRLLLSNPVEFFDRAEVIFLGEKEKLLTEMRATDAYPDTLSWQDGIRAMSGVLGRDPAGVLSEPELQATQQRIARLTKELDDQGNLPFPTVYNANSTMMQLVYLLCRMLAPETVVETGVGYGASSAIILAALHKNHKGVLHSIDLPPIGARASDIQIGVMVPPEYRGRWQLHVGPSKRILPRLLNNGVSTIDLFLHDSAQLYEIQRMELTSVWSHMSPHGVIIADSIHRNTAFAEFTRQRQVNHWFAIEEREIRGHLVGLILESGKTAIGHRSDNGNGARPRR